MAAFNATALADFGHPETTKLEDPLNVRGHTVTFSEVQSKILAVRHILQHSGHRESADAAVIEQT
jgi:hypothetical protein